MRLTIALLGWSFDLSMEPTVTADDDPQRDLGTTIPGWRALRVADFLGYVVACDEADGVVAVTGTVGGEHDHHRRPDRA